MGVTIEHDDRPPPGQMDSVETYAREQAVQSEADVLGGLRELDGAEGVKWHIYRINAEDPIKNGFLEKWGTAMLSQENIRDKFGPGTYKVRGHYPNGTYAAHRTVEIAGDAPRREPTTQEAKNANRGATAPLDMTQLLLLLDERDQRRRAEEQARRDENQSFWKTLAATLAPVVAPKILDMVSGNRNGTVTELLTGLKELRALDGPQKTGASSIKETLETVALLRDAFDVGGSRPGDKSVWDVLTELAKGAGPKIGGVLEALPKLVNGARPHLPINAPPGTGGTLLRAPNSAHVEVPSPSHVHVTASHSVSDAAGESVTPLSTNSDGASVSAAEPITLQTSPRSATPTSGEGEDMNALLIPHIPFLRKSLELWVTKASQNSDPNLYGGLFLDNLPEPLKARPAILLGLLKRDDWWDVLKQVDERAAPYQGWFTELRVYLVDTLEDEIR